ncbi:Heat shock protein DnaJ-like protein [Planktothrix serta PCC 8927]|uniref:Heat shock protein DnaJ-like protein n=1 Tax=Planktothrix serta PCC 8927 TaxID=671068 RepID=A0A7Z9DYC5_9CYAN|nr:IMS domain-containing protein [Planktothrix serta]VXD18214.1 Heat shock protein DnaJ-like protein [Planktothrix serta PCC 8927]
MRIPLDYYRILGLPIQATPEQLKQAHRDRTLQLPRREYSDLAITARKQLIDEAYAVLSDADQRQAYDMGFLAKTYEPESEVKTPAFGKRVTSEATALEALIDSHTPSIEIEDKQFVGALLLLHELGEYELVVKLCHPYLSNGSIGLKDGRFGDPALIVPDIILTVTSAYLELGREQWQQGQYENAASSLEAGQNLLLRESLFASLRGEMQTDLYKLRPYRILELLQLPLEKAAERRKGLQLLREMLHERGGIDGQGEDQSGLGIEDFLRFVQQLRRYITTTEQQALFEAEARRPSAVATYLAVYALIAQGFAEAQPALIRKAKLMLMQLGRRQDVHLEKAVCALLLGQTEEASRSLELSQEREPIAFIRENSQNSPDLLPGLCLYAESWLQDEVFPHFRDLLDKSVSLKDYFADPHVQAYLEALPNETGNPSNEWVVVQPRRPASAPTSSSQSPTPKSSSTATNIQLTQTSSDPPSMTLTAQNPEVSGSGIKELVTPIPSSPPPASVRTSVETGSTSTSLQGSRKSPESSRRSPASSGETRPPSVEPTPSANIPPTSAQTNASPPANSSSLRRIQRKNEASKWGRLLILGLGGLIGVWILWFLLSRTFGALADVLGWSGPTLKGEQAMVQLNQPPLPIPEAKPVTAEPEKITPEVAETKLNQWLSAKSVAMGPDHQVEALQQILVDPALARWVGMAETMKQDGSHRTYKHSLKVTEVQMDQANPNQAVAYADVQEQVTSYSQGKLQNSEDASLQLQYRFIRKDGEWRIEDWQVIR